MRASDYRARARDALRGKWWYMVGTLLTMNFLISIFADVVFAPVRLQGLLNVASTSSAMRSFAVVLLMGIAVGLLEMVIAVGGYRIAGDVLDGGMPYLARLFPMNQFGTILGMNLLRALKTFLWMLPGMAVLLIGVPLLGDYGGEVFLLVGYIAAAVCGVIAAFRYIMADFLLADYASMGAGEAVRESARRMKGYKRKYFCLEISFIGWALLVSLASSGMMSLTMYAGSTALSMVVSLVTAILQSMLQSYMLVAAVAFFRDIPRDRDEQTESIWAETPAEDKTSPEAEPEAMPVDYSAAMELFYLHQCSRRRLNRAGRLSEYEAMAVPTQIEEEWLQKYARALLRRFDSDSAALGGLMELMSEYAMEDLADHTLERIQRYIGEHGLAPQEILGLCGRMMGMLCAGAYADNEAFAQRKREQLLSIVDELEALLERDQADGSWRMEIQRIRNM